MAIRGIDDNCKGEETDTMTMTIEEALGTLIRMANPYTSGAADTMHFAAAKAAKGVGTSTIDPGQIPVEEDRYPNSWAFKGQTQTVQKSIRVQYQYDAMDDKGKKLGYKVTEHLLIGFAGSGGSC
jgi:hypothetical protein